MVSILNDYDCDMHLQYIEMYHLIRIEILEQNFNFIITIFQDNVRFPYIVPVKAANS